MALTDRDGYLFSGLSDRLASLEAQVDLLTRENAELRLSLREQAVAHRRDLTRNAELITDLREELAARDLKHEEERLLQP